MDRESLLESYADLITVQERTIFGVSQDHGLSTKISKPVSETFQLSHEVKIGQDNPLFGLMPNAPATVSKYIFGGQLVGMIDESSQPPKPKLISFFEYGSDNDMSIQNIFNFSNNRNIRLTSGKDEKNVTSLFKEMNICLNSTENSNTNMVIAAPKFISSSGPMFEGVFVGTHLQKINPNIKFGGELTFRRMTTPRGLMSDIVAGFGGSYSWSDEKGPFAETTAKISCQANTPIPSSCQFQHWAKSRVCDKIQALAQLRLEPSSMAMFTGDNSLNMSGKLGYSMKIPDPEAKKNNMMGMPEKDAGTVCRGTLDTDWNVTGTVETEMTDFPARMGAKMSYNIEKDDLKLGLSLNYGEG